MFNISVVNNDSELQKVKHVHLKNLKALIPNISWELINKKKHDPKQVIYNYSSHQLSSHKENILSKGLKFAIPPKHLIHGYFSTPSGFSQKYFFRLNFLQQYFFSFSQNLIFNRFA